MYLHLMEELYTSRFLLTSYVDLRLLWRSTAKATACWEYQYFEGTMQLLYSHYESVTEAAA